jgi:glutathione synthase/RimK-type ligase-like ATP-grasp enzyme
VRRCLPRLPARLESCLDADSLRLAFLVPPSDYHLDWHWTFDPQAEAVRQRGAIVDAVEWTSEEDFAAYDLVLPLIAWGYHEQFAKWHSVLDRFERDNVRIANPVTVLRWNGDKSYLAELHANGVSTVPTLAFDALDESALRQAREKFGTAELVVKPLVSASAYGTHRVGTGDAFPEQVRGWRMLVQPWLKDIVNSGEYSLIFFGGEFSHAVSKVPRPGEFRVQPEYGGIIGPCEPPHGSIELGRAALAASPDDTTYARVDIVVGNDGQLQVIELELIEPALFMADVPDAGPRFADAVLSAARAGME